MYDMVEKEIEVKIQLGSHAELEAFNPDLGKFIPNLYDMALHTRMYTYISTRLLLNNT